MSDRETIHAIIVPRWGMSMEQGLLGEWKVASGSLVAAGDELVDVETEKIANAIEASHPGTLYTFGKPGESYRCGALIGVIAEEGVPETEISAFFAIHGGAEVNAGPTSTEPEPRVIDVQGHRLRYLSLGEGGIPVLMLHGFSGDLNNWLFLQRALSARRATCSVDLPGHGGSSKELAGIASLSDIADILLAFIDALGLAKLHLVAHSMGAAIGVSMVGKEPNRFESLTLLAPADVGSPTNREFIDGLVTAKTRRQMTDVLAMLFVDKGTVSRDMADNLLKFKRLDGVETALAKYANVLAASGTGRLDTLRALKTPMTIVWGAEDRVIPPLSPSVFPANVAFVLVEKTGHMPHIEQSGATAHAIETMLERIG
jgi:pyruvate dehydrogenase E2 component (dihydrolipoamide acetyltransferase)